MTWRSPRRAETCFNKNVFNIHCVWRKLISTYICYEQHNKMQRNKVVATRTAELRRVQRCAGLLISTCCNIFICNRIKRRFDYTILNLSLNIINLPWHFILSITEESFPLFSTALHRTGRNITGCQFMSCNPTYESFKHFVFENHSSANVPFCEKMQCMCVVYAWCFGTSSHDTTKE
jgi:hypothetical protein